MKPKPILNYKESYTMHVINSYRFQEPWVNTGKYTYAELVDMIGVQGYIPVATGVELNSIRNSVSQVMGAGTPFKATYLTGRDKKYVQLKSIDLVSFSSWTPIGLFSPDNFVGEYDGNNLDIMNLTSTGGGLMGVSFNAKIKNTRVYGTINALQNNVGLISSFLLGEDSMFENNFGYGDINASTFSYIGGLIGGTYTDWYYGGIIRDSAFIGNITGGGFVGGIVGASRGESCFIQRCHTLGTITSLSADKRFFGGICGHHGKLSTIEGSYSAMDINTASSLSPYIHSGGIVGLNIGTIRRCYATGNITSLNNAGGLVGASEAGSVISDCWSSGNVHITNNPAGAYPNCGGFIAWCYKGSISNCYSKGLVTGLGNVGGFCGNNTGNITNSYWDTETSGNATSSGGIGKTTTEMKAGLIPDTTIYVGWDNTIWDPGTVNDYPSLIGV